MNKFKVATVQMNALKDDLQHNLDVHARFIAEAARAGCALVEFPELSASAHYGSTEATKFSGPATGGPIFSLIAAETKRHDIVVAYGFCEQARGTFYNSHALVGPKGLIGVQRKVHASGDEYFSFRMGRSFEVFDLGFCRAGTLICYDSLFSESWRVLALKGAEVILAPHAARKGGRGMEVPPEGQLENLRKHRADMPGAWGVHAVENGVFCVYGGQWGFNRHSTHKGGAFGEEAQARKGFTLRTRRPEIYGELTAMM